DLQELKGHLGNFDGLLGLKERLASGWPKMPEYVHSRLATLTAKVDAKPDQSAAIEAQTFLTTAQLRLNDYRDAMRRNEAAKAASNAAKAAYDAYCRVMEQELNALYEDVQDDFSTFYRLIN